MLQNNNSDKILNLFLNNPLEEFQLREISRKIQVAPPSVKKYLERLINEKIIIKTINKTKYPQYKANRDFEYFKFLKKINTQKKLFNIIEKIDENMQPTCIILFGSASRGEDIQSSDIDLFIQSKPKDLRKIIGKLNINIFFEQDLGKISSELKKNLQNGILLKGYIEWDS